MLYVIVKGRDCPILYYVLTESTINIISVAQHRRAYEVGMQVGETSDAINNLLFLISRMFECGKCKYFQQKHDYTRYYMNNL